MRKLSSKLAEAFSSLLHRRGDQAERDDCLKWLRYYLDFCAKYRHPPRDPDSLSPFLQKLASKNQSKPQQEQAAHALGLFYEVMRDWQGETPEEKAQHQKELPWTACLDRLKKEISLRHACH